MASNLATDSKLDEPLDTGTVTGSRSPGYETIIMNRVLKKIDDRGKANSLSYSTPEADSTPREDPPSYSAANGGI